MTNPLIWFVSIIGIFGIGLVAYQIAGMMP